MPRQYGITLTLETRSCADAPFADRPRRERRGGPGNLLGNLLCAVVSLLDAPGIIAGLLQLIDNINAILEGLGGLGGFAGASLTSPSGVAFDPGWQLRA